MRNNAKQEEQQSAYQGTTMSLNASKRTFETFTEPNGTSSQDTSGASPKRPCPEPDTKLWDKITRLPSETLQALLFNICTEHLGARELVQAAHEERLAKLAAQPPRAFDSYARHCRDALDKPYVEGASGRSYEPLVEIVQTLSEAREEIMEGAGPEERYETRRNALDALRQISKGVMLCEHPRVSHGLLSDGFVLNEFAGAMADLAGAMTEEERGRYKGEGYYERLVDLQTHCEWEVEMDGLRDVYEIFDGPDVGGEDAEDSGEEQEEYRAEIQGAPKESGAQEASSADLVPVQAQHNTTLPSHTAAPRRTSVFNIGELL